MTTDEHSLKKTIQFHDITGCVGYCVTVNFMYWCSNGMKILEVLYFPNGFQTSLPCGMFVFTF